MLEKKTLQGLVAANPRAAVVPFRLNTGQPSQQHVQSWNVSEHAHIYIYFLETNGHQYLSIV